MTPEKGKTLNWQRIESGWRSRMLTIETKGEPSNELIADYALHGWTEARTEPVPNLPGWYRTTFQRLPARHVRRTHNPIPPDPTAPPRSARWRRRLAVLAARDGGYRCVYCATPLEPDSPDCTQDHVIPRSRGGADTINNLVIACYACNQDKGDGLPPAKEA